MKKIIFLFTILLLIMSCGNKQETKAEGAAGNTAETKEAKKKIGVLIPGPVGYFVAVREGIDKAAAENNVEITYSDAGWDASKQLSQVEDLISKKVDLIAIAAVDSNAAKTAVRMANEANIPILAFTNAIGDKESGEYEGLITYVGQNEVETGKLTGELAKSLLGEKGGKVVLIEGRPGTSPQINRRKGVMEALDTNKNFEVVYTQTSNWEKEQALKIVEDLIQKNQTIDVIIAQDDNSAIGAGMALKEANLKDKILVIGLGGSTEGLNAVKSGLIDGTTYMSAVEEGYTAITAAVKYLNGEKVEPVTQMKQVEVNKSNVESFKGEW